MQPTNIDNTSRNVIVQKVKSQCPDNFLLAEKYYSLMSEVNGAGLTKRELQLLAFSAVMGNIGNLKGKQEFCKKMDTTMPTVNNMVSKLRRMGWLVKEGRKICPHKAILLNFENDVFLEIKLIHG